ncbi:MAG: glycoside hydrolase family 99-like domain-containing protein [Bacteroidales bacterium]|nr:glycoside hydrolase family 99-like domain-containing protein [Bacteroidales bacterium]MBR4624447.1 glycoside hydrolase family 99-like domain-containing protein [Alphaproteobacteria bacterium]
MEYLPKIFALYLPQFHSISENDKFWCKAIVRR